MPKVIYSIIISRNSDRQMCLIDFIAIREEQEEQEVTLRHSNPCILSNTRRS